ncbi:MAG: hypothetical protein ACP5OU_08280 [Methanothrix sp.]
MNRNGLYAIIAASSFLICCIAGQGTDASLLRIDSPCGWTEHLQTTQGSTFYLVVLPGTQGAATLYDRYPDGTIRNYSYFFLGYDRLPMYADAPGRHAFYYTIAGRQSNSVIVDVLAARLPAPPAQPCCPAAAPAVQRAPAAIPAPVQAPVQAVDLSNSAFSDPVMLQYYPIGAHIMKDRKGIVIPKRSSQYHFGRDFSLGTIDGNYPGTPFILQYLSDP